MNAVTRRERKTETRSRKLGRATKDPSAFTAKYSSSRNYLLSQKFVTKIFSRKLGRATKDPSALTAKYSSSGRGSDLLFQSFEYMTATVQLVQVLYRT